MISGQSHEVALVGHVAYHLDAMLTLLLQFAFYNNFKIFDEYL